MRHPLLIAMLAATLLASCASEPSPRRVATYVVKRGDTVSEIAQRYRVDYRELARVNGIGSDYLIYPGQVLRIPGPSVRNARSLPPTPARPVPPVASVPPPAALPTIWIAPADLTRATFVTRPNGSVGLTFAGRANQEILAAADGRVIYTGVGALGYGLLVIIKHTETCLSAYGYTSSLKVSEGEDVKAGQPIATMGYEPQGSAALYFEIRIGGRTSDPRPLLSATNSVTAGPLLD